MTWELLALLLAAGVAAGVINTIVGAGSLITFPVLLAAGYPPVIAVMINQLGLVPGTISGALAYRPYLPRHPFVVRWCLIACVGAAAGSGLLVLLPSRVVATIVPLCVFAASALVAVQPLIIRRVGGGRPPMAAGRPLVSAAAARPATGSTGVLQVHCPEGRQVRDKPSPGRLVWLGVAAASVYAGWIGVALGVVMIAVLSLGFRAELQQVNALKMLLASVAGLTAVVTYLLTGHTGVWPAALAVGSGNLVGGWLGALVAQRLRPTVLRSVMVTVGVAASVVSL